MVQAFKRIGSKAIKQEEVGDIIKMNDLDGNGVLSFDEFKMLFATDEERQKERSRRLYAKLENPTHSTIVAFD